MGQDSDSRLLQQRLAALEQENRKLRKINEALMERVESAPGHHNRSYAAFEHSALLAEQVRERTEALHHALEELKSSHQALAQAKQEAETTHQRLLDAIESISDAFVLFDRHGRVVLCNSKYRALWQGTGVAIEAGTCIQEITRLAFACGLITELDDDGGAAPAHGRLHSSSLFRLRDGRWVQLNDRRTGNGDLVVLLTDVTLLKEIEAARRERALAQKSQENEQKIRLVTDALPALISYVNDRLCLEFTNKAYQQWHGMSGAQLNGKPIAELYTPPQLARLQGYIDRVMAGETVEFEMAECNAQGETRYVHRAYVPNLDADGVSHGFFVLTQDVTERRKTAEALQNAYQHLEQRVKERTQELTELNAQLRQEISERKQAEARLIEARKAAEHANLTKTKFLAAASHDLLQPMNAARLFTAALAEQALPAEARALVNSVSYSLEDVESLLSSLVDISKLDAGVVTPQRAAFNANDLLLNLANEYRKVAEAERLDFHFVPSSAVIYTDAQLLGRILRNFLSNAMRYTDAGGRVLLGCRRKQDSLVIEVWDTGMGIAEDKLTDIFLEFNRIKHDGRHQDQGLGLGLAIVDKMSRVLEHPIYVHSRPGKGSVFSVEVPYGRPAQMPARCAGARVASVDDALQGVRVLVIDNDASICQGMAMLLGKWGCEVFTYLSLQAFLADTEIQRDGVALIVADYHLDDEENGLQAAAAINRRLPRAVPVLMITANHSPELARQIKRQGHQILYKPVKPLKLKTTLHYMLQAAVQ